MIPPYLWASLLGYWSVALLGSQGVPSLYFGWRDRDSYLPALANVFWSIGGIFSLAGLLTAPQHIVFQIILAVYALICDLSLILEGVLLHYGRCKGIASRVRQKNALEVEKEAVQEAWRNDNNFELKERKHLQAVRPNTFFEMVSIGTTGRRTILIQGIPIAILLVTMTLFWVLHDLHQYHDGTLKIPVPEAYHIPDTAWILGWAGTLSNSLARVPGWYNCIRERRENRDKGVQKSYETYSKACSNLILFSCFSLDNMLQIIAILIISRERDYVLFQLPWICGCTITLVLDAHFIYSSIYALRKHGYQPGFWCHNALSPAKLAILRSNYFEKSNLDIYDDEMEKSYSYRLNEWKARIPVKGNFEDYKQWKMEKPQRHDFSLENFADFRGNAQPGPFATPRKTTKITKQGKEIEVHHPFVIKDHDYVKLQLREEEEAQYAAYRNHRLEKLVKREADKLYERYQKKQKKTGKTGTGSTVKSLNDKTSYRDSYLGRNASDDSLPPYDKDPIAHSHLLAMRIALKVLHQPESDHIEKQRAHYDKTQRARREKRERKSGKASTSLNTRAAPERLLEQRHSVPSETDESTYDTEETGSSASNDEYPLDSRHHFSNSESGEEADDRPPSFHSSTYSDSESDRVEEEKHEKRVQFASSPLKPNRIQKRYYRKR